MVEPPEGRHAFVRPAYAYEENELVSERKSVCERERARVCVCVREREFMRVCVCVMERDRERASGVYCRLTPRRKGPSD